MKPPIPLNQGFASGQRSPLLAVGPYSTGCGSHKTRPRKQSLLSSARGVAATALSKSTARGVASTAPGVASSCFGNGTEQTFLLLGVRSRCLWLSGETELKSYNCTFSRARSAIQPTHILAQEESEQGLPLAGTNLTTPLTTVQFSGACSSLSAHSPGTPVSGVNWSHQSGIYW